MAGLDLFAQWIEGLQSSVLRAFVLHAGATMASSIGYGCIEDSAVSAAITNGTAVDAQSTIQPWEPAMSPEEEVLRAFYDIRDALCAPDPAALERLIAEDYRGFDLRGDIEQRQTILDSYVPGKARLTKFELDEIATHVFGEIGLVTGLGRIAGIYENDRFHHSLRFCDIFVRRDSRWRLFFTQNTEIAAYSAGQTLDE
jgi:ketosteroid isomerase-like protein